MSGLYRDMQKLLLLLEHDKQKALGTIISFIKDLKPKEAHNKDLLRVWTCIITGISSVIEAERRSYLLKPSSFKEKSLQKLGNDYRWILSNVPEQVIRTVWPKVIVPQICSTLNQPEDGCMCRPLSLSGAQILRRILSVRYYKHHLSEKLWKELLNVCLGLIISKDSGKLLKTTICEILAMLVGSNRSLRDSYYGIISVIFNFLKDSRNESHCTTILASVLNYTLIETSPEILCEYGACALLSDNLPAIISNFSSARVGTRLLCHLTNMLRHLASADIFSLDEKQHYSKPMHPSNSPGSSLLLDLHEIILDKVDLSFPDNVEEFIKLISGSGDIEKHSLLLGSRSKTGYNNTACFRYSDRSDIYTMLLELHTKILLKIIENDQPEKVISHSPPTKGVKCGTYVIDRIIELALSDGKLNQNRKLWCIKVLCVLITFIDGCTPSIILDIWDKVCSMCERCATAVSEKKKIQWLMVLIGSILHSESIKRRIEIDAVCSPSFAARVRQLSELALQGISQDEMRGPSFFVIEGVIRLVISRNLRSIIIWLEQELLQIMKQEMTVLILAEFRSYALLFSMANSGCSDSNLGIMLDRFMGCAINDVLKLPDSRNTHSASALTVQNASIVIHLLCDNPEFHKSANYDLHCLQMITSPFAVLPEEQLLVEYRLSFLSCVFHNLRSGSPLSILTKSCFNNIPNPSDLPFYTTRCYHTHINVEVTNYIARRFYNYLYKNSREGCSSHDSSIPIDKQLILRSTLLLLLSLDWITLLKFCGPQCRLNSTGPHLNNLLQLIVENLASDLDSCASEIIASHDIISNVYEILYRIGELFPKIGSTCGDYGIITELESKASILIYKKSIFRIYNKLLEVLHYILEKLSTVDQSGTLGGNLDVDRSDYDTREAPKYIDHPCIHLDVLYGYDALKESDSSKITLTGDHSCCSTIDCLRILSNLIRFITNRKGVSNISDDVDIPSAVTDLLPTLYSKSIRSAFCLLNWLSDVSSDITQDRMYIVTNVCSEMLSEYRYEEDFVVWIFVIRCLTAIVPSMTGLNLKSRILNNVSQILLFFSRRLYNNSASWRVLYELENFIKTCMKTRVVHILLNCITQHQQDTGWINNTLSFLVKHANFLVMASACEICVMKICCDGTDSETRNTIYSDISAITLDNKLLFTVSAMALGFCMVKSDEYRMEALVCLLQNIGNYDSIVMQVISDAAKYLKYGSVQNFLRKEMFPIICCWKQYSMEQFPYRYAGYDSLVDMYKDMGHYMAFFVLQKSNFEESVLFPNVKLDKMSLDKILVDTLPLVLSKNMPCIIKDIFSTQTTGESEKGEDLLKNISKILERNKVELDGYTDAKLVAIANILYWCVDTEHDITHRASEPPTKHKFHRLKVVIEDALTYRSLIEGKSSLPADAYSVNYLKSIYGDERAFYTTQYAAAAVLLLTGVYNRLANSVKINEDFLSKAEQVFDDEMVYRILLIIGNKLRDEKFTNRKKIFLRYGYILFLTLFEKYLYNSFFLGLLFSHIYPLLADIDFHDEACVIIDQICYKFAENDPESLEDRFVYIVNQLARTVKDAVYSQQREIVASTINLIQLVFMRSRNIDEKIVKLGKAQVTFETKELVNIDFDNENPEIFVNIPSLTHSMVHSDFISIDILTKYIEEYSAIPSREKVNINNTSLKDIVKKLINVYSNSNSYKKIFDKNVGRAIYSLLSLSDELSEIYPSNLEAAVSTNFYTQAVSMVSSRAMRFESEFSEQLVHIVKTLISSEDGRVEFHKLPRSVANVVKKVKLFSKPEESLTLCQRVYPNIMCAETWVPPLKSSSAGYRCQNYDNPKKSFEKWVVNLANSLLTSISFDGFYKALPRLFEIESSLAEVLLPHLIYKCLTSYPNTKILGDSHSCITKSQRINTVHAFLSCNINNILNNFMEYDDRVSKLIIDAVEFLVLKKLYRFDTPFDSYKWLDIDYLNLAKAAYSQNMHVSALRFIELSLEDDVLGGSIGKVSEHLNSSTSISLNTSISSSAELNREKMDLLTKIWARINDKTYTMITPPEKDQLSSNETSLSTDSTLNLNLGASDSSLKRLPCDLTMPLSSDDFSVSWHRVITECESRLRSSTFNLDQNTSSVESQLNTDIMEALCRMGRYHTLNVYADGILLRQKLRRDILPLFKVESEGSARFLELMFEGKWRNGDYFKEEKEKLSRNPQFHQLLCKSLDAIRKYDISAFRYLNEENLHRELEKFIDKGSRFSFDQIKNILVLTEFTEIADIIQKHMDAQSYVATEKLFINRDSLSTLLDTWNSRFNVLTTRYKFSDVELIIEARGALLKALADGSKHIKLEPEEYNHVNLRSILFEAIYSLWFDYANLARRACRYDVALHQIPKLKALVCSEVSEVEKDKFLHIQEKLLSVSFENMKIMWDSGTMIPSKQRFQSIRNQVLPLLNFQNDPAGVRRMSSVAAKLISCLGKWAGESQSEDPQTICYDYFDTAISIAHQDKAHKDLDLLYYVYEKYAKFAHEQYNILSMTDPTSEMKTYIDYKLNELKVCEELSNSKDPKFSSELKPKAVYQRLSKKLKLQIDLGNQEIDTYHNKVSMFFSIAVRNYLLSLQVGDDDLDLSAFRLCVLWFSKLHEREVCRMIDKHLNNIPSHKFVPLFYQLAARSVCLEPNDYSLKILQKIIYKTALEHPHHTLYHLIALNNTNEDGNGMKKKFVVHILNALRTQRKSHYSEILTNMEFLTKKLIELMAVDIPSSVLKKTKSFEIDDVSDIRSISNSHIAVPVHKYPVSKSSTYDDIPTLQYFKPRFSVPGGINKPKIVHCMGSDGVEYSLLIKGKDDLRQDSVLMSIFNLVNGLFTQDTESRNKLKIRLYKVVPLAQRAGIVEWIGNTTPIGTYLTEAHAMYNPKDYSPALAHAKMYAEYKKQDSSPEMKLRVFKDVMKHFSPVFRHFFFENYRSAAEWFACRSAYTRSLAATSIAGYIVGLGDRHAHNILIDRSSGELIHVDFGVAFEQGKLLSVPETVPFRLTRDMADGLGSTGCEGMFKRSCEDTLAILKKSSEIFILILNVFKYDPLYNWKLSPLEQYKRQGFGGDILSESSIIPNFSTSHKENEPENREAKRAVFNVNRKLSSPLSIKCQVNELIEAASDPKNLCTMYPGWM